MSAGKASATDITENGISYHVDEASGTATVQGYDYSNPPVNAIIPDAVSVDGKDFPVTYIAQYSLYGVGIESLTLGANVSVIDNAAFAYCSVLSEVTLNENLNTIGAEAFRYCSSLTTIQIPQTVESIGSYAFHGCSLSGEIELPRSLSTFGTAPFRGCPVSLFTIADTNNSFATVEGVILSKDGTRLMAYPAGSSNQKYTVPASVTAIENESMRDCQALEELVLPDGLKSIGQLAFVGDGLKNITIPASVDDIGYGFLMSNEKLEGISVDASNSSFKVENGLLIAQTDNEVIATTATVSDLVIPDGVENIGSYTFYGMNQLISVKFPETLKTTGLSSFYGCQRLTTLDLGSGIQSIGKQSFQNCAMLGSVRFPASLRTIGMQAFSNCSSMTEVILNDGLEEIGQSAFYGCTGIKKVRVPGSAREFGYSIFYGCTALEEAVLEEGLSIIPEQMFNYDENLSKLTIPSTIEIIDEAALYGTAISEITLPEKLRIIGPMALYGTQIEEIVLPDAVEEIGEFGLAWNMNLRTIKCGKGLKTIGESAISSLPVLENIELNEGLESIGYMGISYCDIMTSLTIPSTVTEIGSYAFIGSPLNSLVNKAVTPQTLYDGEDLVSNPAGETIYDSCTLYVPAESVQAYKNAAVWKLFTKIEPLSSGISETITVSDETAEISSVYTIDGKRIPAPRKGINLIKMTDGTVKKVFIK